jgi:hypothetical protein
MHDYHEKNVAGKNEEQVDANTTDHTQEHERYFDIAAEYGLEDEMEIGDSGCNVQSVEQEYMAYTTAALSDKSVNTLKFWEVSNNLIISISILTEWHALQTNRTMFPTIFTIAMDYLPVQASSVPCERVFSSSSETDTKRRNRISPPLMEALQMLKFFIKKARLDFTAGWKTSDSEMGEEKEFKTNDAEDPLQKVLRMGTGFENQLDDIIHTIAEYEG